LDIKLFYKEDGSIVQLIEMEKINEWPLEMPLIFVEYIKSNKLRSYRDSTVEAEISEYLDEILNKIAIPKVKNVLDSNNDKEIISILSIFEDLSETNSRAILPLQPLIEKLIRENNKTISSQAKRILANIK
jgi:hypothetical protein